MPLWITNGKVFRKAQKNRIHAENNQKQCRNQCSMLEEEDIEECNNNNIIAHCISENVTLKETNELLNEQANESIAMHEIEKMKVEEMEACF